MRLLMVIALAFAALVPVGQAHAWQVGDTASCYGMAGPIIRVDERPGWDVPWYIVKSGINELRCKPDELRPAPAAAAQPIATPAPAAAQPQFKVGDTAACYGMAGPIIRVDERPGWDVPWYIVKSGINELRCTPDQLRAAGGAPVQAPGQAMRPVPVAMPQPAPARPPAAVVPVAQAPGQDFKVGDTAECYGNIGPIIRIDQRPGWDVPWYIVDHLGTEFKCTPDELRHAVAPPSDEALCRVGNKVEGRWGISWYAVTVLRPLEEQGCWVRFDGYGEMWDTYILRGSLRPAGSGPITRPTNPVPDTVGEAAPGTVPDGTYQCEKIVGDGMQGIGTVSIRNGVATGNGWPEGWSVRSLDPPIRDPRGLLVGVNITTATGVDKLDCLR